MLDNAAGDKPAETGVDAFGAPGVAEGVDAPGAALAIARAGSPAATGDFCASVGATVSRSRSRDGAIEVAATTAVEARGSASRVVIREARACVRELARRAERVSLGIGAICAAIREALDFGATRRA